MEYQFTPLTIHNQNNLKVLYKAVFGITITYKQINQKYNTTYLGKSHFGYFAFFNEKPVAFFGTIPIVMEYNGQKEISAQSVDSMVLPSHSGKGLFTKLGVLTLENLKNNGITFIWGFANQHSENRLLKSLGFTLNERIEGYKIKVLNKSFEKILRKNIVINHFYEKYCNNVFAKYHAKSVFKGSLNTKEVLASDRNYDFYLYKKNNSNFVIKLKGVFFWIKIKSGLLVGDIQLNSESNFDGAINELKKLAKKCGIKEIVFQTSPNTTISKLLKNKNIEQFDSWAVCYKDISSNFPLEKLKFTFGDLDTF